MKQLRAITVHAAPELLPLAELPIADPVFGCVLELDGLVEGLEAGRLLVVAGERVDLPGVADLAAAELARVAEVRHGTVGGDVPTAREDPGGFGSPAPGERNHTFLYLERP
ncbi:hypothetical protein ACFQ0M_09135 [Kitasatospora aburaviensis]